VACYVDEVLVISRDPMAIIDVLKDDCILKGIDVPTYYLGGNIDELGEDLEKDDGEELEKDGMEWALSAQTYIENNGHNKL
jgi:hypothetical protein